MLRTRLFVSYLKRKTWVLFSNLSFDTKSIGMSLTWNRQLWTDTDTLASHSNAFNNAPLIGNKQVWPRKQLTIGYAVTRCALQCCECHPQAKSKNEKTAAMPRDDIPEDANFSPDTSSIESAAYENVRSTSSSEDIFLAADPYPQQIFSSQSAMRLAQMTPQRYQHEPKLDELLVNWK